MHDEASLRSSAGIMAKSVMVCPGLSTIVMFGFIPGIQDYFR
jgi:hypothetical protein